MSSKSPLDFSPRPGPRALSALLLTTVLACTSDPEVVATEPPPRDPTFAALRTIKGRLTWPDSLDTSAESYLGTPLEGFRIVVYRLGDRLQRFEGGTTDKSGRFELRDLAFYTGERLAFAVERNERRYAICQVQRIQLTERSGPKMSDFAPGRRINVIDSTEAVSGRHDAQAFRVEPKRVVTSLKSRWNPSTKKAEKVAAEPVGELSDKTWSGIELFAIPIVPEGENHWSDGTPTPGVKERHDVLIDDLPESISAPELRARLVQNTFILDPSIKRLDLAALARTGLRKQDLFRLDEHAPYPSAAEPKVQALEASLTATRWPLDYPRPLSKETRAALKKKTIALSPGHGAYLSPKGPSSEPESWRSPRSFMSRAVFSAIQSQGIIEDELTFSIARRVLTILEESGADVLTLRELRDLTREGLDHPAPFEFAPFSSEAAANLPRLWEQSAKYYLAATAPELLGSKDDSYALGWSGTQPPRHSADAPLDEDSRSLAARIALLAHYSEKEEIDCMVSIHTNARGNGAPQTNARGPLGIYLDFNEGEGASKNPHEVLARSITEAVAARAGTKGKLISMRELGRGLTILRDSFPYFYEVPADNPKNKTASFNRQRNAPKGAEIKDLAARELTNLSQGWHRQPFPKSFPAALIECGYHDHPEEAALLERGWYQQSIARAIAVGIARSFGAKPAKPAGTASKPGKEKGSR